MAAQSTRFRAGMVVACGALVVVLSMGIRQAFGIFLEPVSAVLGTGRESYSLAIAWQNLVFGLPLVGLLADRFGARPIVLVGGLLYGAGLLLVPLWTTPAALSLTLGLLVGLALSCTSYVVVLGAVARVVPPERRSTAFGVTTAAGSFGMFAMVPAAQTLLSSVGWQMSFLMLATVACLMVLLAAGFPGRPTDDEQQGGPDAQADAFVTVLRRAGGHSGYWLLTAGFFVCGFHVAFIATHLPAFLADQQVPPLVGAWALALIGFFNIIGSYLFGMLGDRYRKKYLLGLLYLARALVIGGFLFFPISSTSALIFGAAIGFLWLATVPLTSGMVAQIFGSRYLSTLYGIVFFSHQIGSFLGVWLGGRVYDVTGSYNVVWLAALALGVLAAVLHLPITDSPAWPRQPVPVPASGK